MRGISIITNTAQKFFTKSSTDSCAELSNSELLNTLNKLPKEALITLEGANIRFTLEKTEPTQGAENSSAVGHILYSGQSILFLNSANIKNFSFISQLNTVHATLQITLFY